MTNFLLLLLFLSSPVDAKLDAKVRELASRADGTVGVAVTNLERGWTYGLRENERFPMGSVFKLPTGITLLQKVERGELSLQHRYTLQPSDYHPGWSPIADAAHDKPKSFTLEELLTAMVRDSDNSAADFILRLVGGPAAVTKTMRDLQIDGIRVDRSEAEMTRDLYALTGLPPEREWSRAMWRKRSAAQTRSVRRRAVAQYAIDPRDTATPRSMLRLLELLQTRKVNLSSASIDRLLQLMSTTTTGAKRIKSVLPAGATIAHKTGTMPGTANDAAIVTLPNGEHLLVVIFVRGGTRADESQEASIAAIARAIFAHAPH